MDTFAPNTLRDDPVIERRADLARELEDAAALIQASRDLLSSIDGVLEALARGQYGTCEQCGEPIHADVLSADVLAACCPKHARPEVAGQSA